MDAFLMILGGILFPIVRIVVVLAVCLGIIWVWYHAAAKALMDGAVLFGLPTISYLVLYFLIIDIPMLGGPDILDIKGIEAEHEILKMFLVGLPLFFLVAFYLQWKNGLPLLLSLAYSLICWVAAVAACFTVILLIALIGIMLIGKFTGKVLIPAATETNGGRGSGASLMYRCPNCQMGIPVGHLVCPHCGITIDGRDDLVYKQE